MQFKCVSRNNWIGPIWILFIFRSRAMAAVVLCTWIKRWLSNIKLDQSRPQIRKERRRWQSIDSPLVLVCSFFPLFCEKCSAGFFNVLKITLQSAPLTHTRTNSAECSHLHEIIHSVLKWFSFFPHLDATGKWISCYGAVTHQSSPFCCSIRWHLYKYMSTWLAVGTSTMV